MTPEQLRRMEQLQTNLSGTEDRMARMMANLDELLGRLDAANVRAEELIGRYEAAILEAEDTLDAKPFLVPTGEKTPNPRYGFREDEPEEVPLARMVTGDMIEARARELFAKEAREGAEFAALPRSVMAQYLREAREELSKPSVVTATDLIGFQGAVKPDHYIIEADHSTINNPDFMGFVVRDDTGNMTWFDNRAVHREQDSTFMIYRSRLDQLDQSLRDFVSAHDRA